MSAPGPTSGPAIARRRRIEVDRQILSKLANFIHADLVWVNDASTAFSEMEGASATAVSEETVAGYRPGAILLDEILERELPWHLNMDVYPALVIVPERLDSL